MILLHIVEEAGLAVASSATAGGVDSAALGAWLGALLLLATVCLTAGEICPTGFFTSNATTEEHCVQCTECGPGEETVEPCGPRSDSVCLPCPAGHFSRLAPGGGGGERECVQCRSCGPERTEASPCTPTTDRVCGNCSDGYFQPSSSGDIVCLRCSKCPSEGDPVRWADCEAAGEPVDNRCAPGQWDVEGSTSAGLERISVVKPTYTAGKAVTKTRLPTGHGMFVPMTNYDTLDLAPPTNTDSERNIAIMSLVFTAGTTIAFITALSCLFRDKIFTRRWIAKTVGHLPRRHKHGKTKYPIQAESDNSSQLNHHSAYRDSVIKTHESL